MNRRTVAKKRRHVRMVVMMLTIVGIVFVVCKYCSDENDMATMMIHLIRLGCVTWRKIIYCFSESYLTVHTRKLNHRSACNIITSLPLLLYCYPATATKKPTKPTKKPKAKPTKKPTTQPPPTQPPPPNPEPQGDSGLVVMLMLNSVLPAQYLE